MLGSSSVTTDDQGVRIDMRESIPLLPINEVQDG